MHPASPDPQSWIQYVLVAAAGIAVFVGTIFQYIKKGKAPSAGDDVAVVSATFADRRTIEHLAEALDRHERALDRHERSVHDLCEESRRTREAVASNTDAQINMLAFMKGRIINDP